MAEESHHRFEQELNETKKDTKKLTCELESQLRNVELERAALKA
jgi:hypothetical protein